MTAARADDELAVVLLGDFLLEARDIAVEVLPFGGIRKQGADALDLEVPGNVVIGPVAHRFDRGVELLRVRDDDDFDVRKVLLRDLQHVESGDAAQVDLEQHQVHVFLLHHLEGGLAGRGSQHAVVAPQGGCQRFAHLLVAVDDEQCLPPV